MKSWIAIGVGLVAWSCAAAELSAAPPADRDPDWLRRPTADSLMAVWPAKALKSGRGGSAVISCKTSIQGSLFNCTVVSEDPADWGFGGAALALTPQLLMKPAIRGGVPVEGEVRIPINFPEFTPSNTGSRLDMSLQTVLSNVLWTTAPTYAEAVEAYPAKAREQKLGGHASLSCAFTKEATLKRCSVLTEAPRGLGFGQAAKALATRFTGPPALADGKSIRGAETQILFTFAPEMLSPTPTAMGRPKWVETPNGEAFWASYPPSALKAGVTTARVTLSCKVLADGRLDACGVASEEPAGQEIGKAALALAPGFRLAIWSDEGLPVVGGRVRVPIRYQLQDEAPAAK